MSTMRRYEVRIDYISIILEVKTGIPFTVYLTLIIILFYLLSRLLWTIPKINLFLNLYYRDKYIF